MNRLKLVFILICINLIGGCGTSSTSGNIHSAVASLPAESDVESETGNPDSLETFVPRDSDCICIDHCTADCINTDCPICSAAETLDTVCLGMYPEIYGNDEKADYIYFDSDEVYAPDFLPSEVWDALPNSLPIYLKNMGLSKVHELHYVENSIVNTDCEKSFIFVPENEADIRIKVSYIDGKLDYTMSISNGGKSK